MFVRMANERWRSAWALVGLWAIATLIDLDKPFHVDDSFHLEMAQWITEHPTAPMSGRINWGEGLVPMHAANQPPGFYYLIALTGKLFGYGEVPMHLMRSLFTLLSIVCFHRLARRFHAPHALLLTALLALGPAFLVNQGLMVDMPLLALHLLFFDLLLRRESPSRWREIALAGVVLGAAVLVKYTTLPLLVVFPVALLLRKEGRWMFWCVVPIAITLLWSWWNISEFGFAHVLSRAPGAFVWLKPLKRLGAFSCCLGAVAPFTLLFVAGSVPRWRERTTQLLGIFCACALLLALSVYFSLVREGSSDRILFWVFMVNGVLLLLIAGRMARGPTGMQRTDRSILVLWLVLIALFVILFAPTMGTKHVLLILPPLLLLCAPALEGLELRSGQLAVVMTATLGILLAVADKAHARFYQEGATVAARELTGERTVWSVGLWGWKWYTRQEGMFVYPDDPQAARPLGVNDILVKAEGVHAPNFPPGLELQQIKQWSEPRPWWTFLYVGDFGSMYTADFGRLPWRFDRDAHNTITVYRVLAVP